MSLFCTTSFEDVVMENLSTADMVNMKRGEALAHRERMEEAKKQTSAKTREMPLSTTDWRNV